MPSWERYTWALLNLLILLSSLFGDTMVLYGSIKHRAIRLHRITVALIQHLALLDLVLALNRVLLMTVSLLADTWLFGEGLCITQQYIDKVCYRVIYALTCALTTTKLLTVKYPLKSGMWSQRKAQKLCLVVELVSVVLVSPFLYVYYSAGRSALFFSRLTYNCGIDADITTSSLPPQLKLLLYNLLEVFLPACFYIIPFVTSVLLLHEARRVAYTHRQHLRWEGVVTVLLTCIAYYISSLPHTFLLFFQDDNYLKVAEFLLNINVMINFWVYTLTVRSFRTFLVCWFSKGFRRFVLLFQRCRTFSSSREVIYENHPTGIELHRLGLTQ